MFGFKALGEEGSEAEARVDAMIERFGFDADAEPYLLNRGTRQLLALASIIVLAPPTIILDEPTTGLDFRECVKVMDVVRELNENGTTVIMVCHDMEVVGDFARRVIAMTAGRVVADGPTFEVLRDGRVLKEAHILPPQVTEVSLILGREAPVPRPWPRRTPWPKWWRRWPRPSRWKMRPWPRRRRWSTTWPSRLPPRWRRRATPS